jgi:hypothetical protein
MKKLCEGLMPWLRNILSAFITGKRTMIRFNEKRGSLTCNDRENVPKKALFLFERTLSLLFDIAVSDSSRGTKGLLCYKDTIQIEFYYLQPSAQSLFAAIGASPHFLISKSPLSLPPSITKNESFQIWRRQCQYS